MAVSRQRHAPALLLPREKGGTKLIRTLRIYINPLNAELSPIYHFLALLGAHPILHISGVRVK